MMSKIFSAAVYGIDAVTISVEVHIGSGKKGFFLSGLPDNAVKESSSRIEAALKTNRYQLPSKRLIVNLAPADIRKEGSAFDLGIAIGLLISSNQLVVEKVDRFMFVGELSLDGKLKPVKGILPVALTAKREKFEGIILPEQNAGEAAVVDGLHVYPAACLKEVVDHITNVCLIEKKSINVHEVFKGVIQLNGEDFEDVKGQENIKRALEIAAAGGHNVILIGPPGSGKTMLAKRLPGILPPLSLDEAIETTKVHSVAGKLDSKMSLVCQRPFRSPHHTISDVALVGGGGFPQPGEISLAHNGVLFLDELPEFKRTVLEVMRQPLEERKVSIARAKFSVDFPASYMLVASMNPCPCGFFNHPSRDCVCAPGIVQKYLNRISGPLLDRIDLHVEVTPVPFEELSMHGEQETSVMIRARVISAREIQKKRFEGKETIYCNAQMGVKDLQVICHLNKDGEQLIKNAMQKLDLSARAYDRILKVARTIADLDASDDIATTHLAEAIQYRSLDREGWAG